MNPVDNPYAPGAGQRPPELAGREPEIERFGILTERLQAGRPERGMILTGLRGVGKTVLLEEFRSQAEDQGWVVAFIEVGNGRPFRLLAAQSLTTALRAILLRHRSTDNLRRALGVFKALPRFRGRNVSAPRLSPSTYSSLTTHGVDAPPSNSWPTSIGWLLRADLSDE